MQSVESNCDTLYTMKAPRYIFFGTGHYALPILHNLKSLNFLPSYIVTTPDRPVGRHQILTAPLAKTFAIENNIPVYQPESLKNLDTLEKCREILKDAEAVVVADYGNIIPQNILDLSENGFLNIHPSLLPEYRGPTPVQAAILNNNRHTGVTIIKMDNLMDHGPIIAQEKASIDPAAWPCSLDELYSILAKIGAELLVQTLSVYIEDKSIAKEQDHKKATYVKLIDKADSEVNIKTDPISSIYLKYQAYQHWPGIFFIHAGKRVKIKKMSPNTILQVTPEGKKEMDFVEYLKHHPLT